MRWLGALLVTAACGGVGLQRVSSLRRKINLLDLLCERLRLLQTELIQRNTPLPELLEQLGQPQIAQGLRQGRTMQAAAKPMLQRLETDLPQAAETLDRLAGVLGRYDTVTQAEACSYAMEQLTTQSRALTQELAEKGNLYRTVPLAFGLMAALAVL